MDRRGELVVRLEVETGSSRGSCFIDNFLQEATADARSLARLGYGHLSDFELSRCDDNEGAAADGIAVLKGEEDSAAFIEDGRLRIGEGVDILRFENELARDPLLVEEAEGEFVTRFKLADFKVQSGVVHGASTDFCCLRIAGAGMV